jgi:hypothetical protein
MADILFTITVNHQLVGFVGERFPVVLAYRMRPLVLVTLNRLGIAQFGCDEIALLGSRDNPHPKKLCGLNLIYVGFEK